MLQTSLLQNKLLGSLSLIFILLTGYLSAATLFLERSEKFECPDRVVQFYCNATNTTELRWCFLDKEALFINFDVKGTILMENEFNATLTSNLAIQGQLRSMTSVLTTTAKASYNGSEVTCSDGTSTKSELLLITGFPTAPEHIEVTSNKTDCMSTLMTVTWDSSPTNSYTLSLSPDSSQVLTNPPAEVTVPNGLKYNVSITATNCIGTSIPGYILLNAAGCSNLSAPIHGFVINPDSVCTSIGSTVQYQCNTDLDPEIDNTATCSPKGSWNPNPADLVCTGIAPNPTGSTTLVVEPSVTSFSDIPTSSDPGQSNKTVVIALGCVAGVIALCFFSGIVIVIVPFALRRPKNSEITNIELVQSPSLSSLRSMMSLRLQPGMSQFVNANMIISSDSIRLLDSIGEGEFGIVYKAHLVTNIHEMPQLVAVKTLKHYYNSSDSYKLIQESKKMINLNHPNVLTLIGVCVDAGPAPYLIMPLLAQGNLLSYLRKHRPELIFYNNTEIDIEMMTKAEKKMLDMCVQISKGMEYLAQRKLVHRDLAARNCMVNLNSIIKVADFGLTEDIYTRNYFKQGSGSSVKLPIKWMAPESLSDGIFNEATDMWSFGVTCWEVYSGGCVPYPGISPLALQRELAMGKRMDKPLNDACSNEVYEIMLNCWSVDPEDRPMFSESVVSLSKILSTMAGYFELSPTVTAEQPSQQTGQPPIHLQTQSSKQTESIALKEQDPNMDTQSSTDHKEQSRLVLSGMSSTEECHYLAS